MECSDSSVVMIPERKGDAGLDDPASATSPSSAGASSAAATSLPSTPGLAWPCLPPVKTHSSRSRHRHADLTAGASSPAAQSDDTSPSSRSTVRYLVHPSELPTIRSSTPTPSSGSVHPFQCLSKGSTPRSAKAATPRAQDTTGTALAHLPDDVLLRLWDCLDPTARRALYHSCKALWISPALNSVITTCVCNSIDDLLTWPRNAPPPSCLRLVNGHIDASQPQQVRDSNAPLSPTRTQSGADSDGDKGDHSFLLLLEAAREHPRAMDVLANVTHVILQGRGKGTELCKRLAWLLGPLCPRLSRLLVDWCSMNGESCATAGVWLSSLTHLTLTAVNSVELQGSWPQPLLTYTDLANLRGLTRLELIDCHLPFLELGVQDIAPLSALSALRALHLVFADKEYEWPGSKPCYLLLGLGEVSQGCSLLEELVLDGVQLAKMTSPTWPSLTTLALGYLSGWHPSLVTSLELHTRAPKLNTLTLGRIKCSGYSVEAKLLFANRLLGASTSLAACAAPPAHLTLSVPPAFTDTVPLSTLLSSLHPMQPTLRSLAIETDFITAADTAVMSDLVGLEKLSLCLRKPCGAGLTDLLDRVTQVTHVDLSGAEGQADDSNVLGLLYGALSSVRMGPLTVTVHRPSAYAYLCVQQMRCVRGVGGHPVTLRTV